MYKEALIRNITSTDPSPGSGAVPKDPTRLPPVDLLSITPQEGSVSSATNTNRISVSESWADDDDDFAAAILSQSKDKVSSIVSPSGISNPSHTSSSLSSPPPALQQQHPKQSSAGGKQRHHGGENGGWREVPRSRGGKFNAKDEPTGSPATSTASGGGRFEALAPESKRHWRDHRS